MYIRKIKYKNGKTFIQLLEGYRDSENKVRNKVVHKFGYLDVLLDEHKTEDNLEIYLNEIKKKYEDEKELNKFLKVNLDEELGDESSLKNVGYTCLKPLYKSLNITNVCNAIQKNNPKFSAKISNILEFLIYSKIVNPSSKRSAYLNINNYFDRYDFSEDAMYRALSYIGNNAELIKDYVYMQTSENYPIDTSTTYYDGTNFYFEIDKPSGIKQSGPSKEGRSEPIVSLGLLVDKNQIPIDYILYPGNEQEKTHFTTVINELKTKEKIKGKTIIVADKGLNTGTNIATALKNGFGYIYSQQIKGKSKIFDPIIESSKFTEEYDKDELVYKYTELTKKDTEIWYKENGIALKGTTNQKIVLFWSKKYDEKTKRERDKLIRKANKFIKSPKDYANKKIGDSAKYVNFITTNKQGEYLYDAKSQPVLNQKKIELDAKYDGYYAIVTSEINMEAKEIIAAYKNLVGIERNFRVTKTFLKIRPVYLNLEERIRAHVLISYLSLLFIKLLEVHILKNRYTIEHIIKEIREYQCSYVQKNYYLLFKKSQMMKELCAISGSLCNLDLRYTTRGEISMFFDDYANRLTN